MLLPEYVKRVQLVLADDVGQEIHGFFRRHSHQARVVLNLTIWQLSLPAHNHEEYLHLGIFFCDHSCSLLDPDLQRLNQHWICDPHFDAPE